MSQVKFNTKIGTKNVEVVGGYDRPLDYYHLTIFSLDNNDNDDNDVVWSCLEDLPNPFSKSVEPLKDILKQFNIVPPEFFWDYCSKKEGNVFYTWNKNHWSVINRESF